MDYVFGASPLIYLGKVQALEKVSFLSGKKYLPLSVYTEVVIKGLERRDLEALYIDNLIKEKKFFVEKNKRIEKTKAPLSQADLDVIFLAKEKKAVAIIDEIYAREVADSFGVRKHGTIYIILLLLRGKIITKKEAREYIDKIVQYGFYLSIEEYKEAMEKINKM